MFKIKYKLVKITTVISQSFAINETNRVVNIHYEMEMSTKLYFLRRSNRNRNRKNSGLVQQNNALYISSWPKAMVIHTKRTRIYSLYYVQTSN